MKVDIIENYLLEILSQFGFPNYHCHVVTLQSAVRSTPFMCGQICYRRSQISGVRND